MSNKIVLLDKAQISLDSLPRQDYLSVSKTIKYLVTFPSHPLLQVHKLKSKENKDNYFLARAGLKYRIIFQHQDDVIVIADIVNHDRLERLYGSTVKKESLIEIA